MKSYKKNYIGKGTRNENLENETEITMHIPFLLSKSVQKNAPRLCLNSKQISVISNKPSQLFLGIKDIISQPKSAKDEQGHF